MLESQFAHILYVEPAQIKSSTHATRDTHRLLARAQCNKDNKLSLEEYRKHLAGEQLSK